MQLNTEPLAEMLDVQEEFTAHSTTLGVEDFFPAELTHAYTNGIAITKISHPSGDPALQRLVYAPCVNRRITVVEYRYVNGRFVAYPPPELANDNSVDGMAVNPIFVWIDVPGNREQLRLYCTAPQPDNGGIWTVRFCYPDLPIYRVRQ
jgi:hypothetical protein